MLTYYQWGLVAFTGGQFHRKCSGCVALPAIHRDGDIIMTTVFVSLVIWWQSHWQSSMPVWKIRQSTGWCFCFSVTITVALLIFYTRLLIYHILWLTYWGQVMHICISKLTIIGSDNGLSPGQWQALIWTNAGILFIKSYIFMQENVFENVVCKMPTILSQPQCVDY